jgi:hypothetical protein
MALMEPITSYSISVAQTSYLDYTRVIRLKLESGTNVYIGFPEVRPADWLQLPPDVPLGNVNIFMTADQYDDVYHILQTEDPAFCTALNLEALQLGAVHTELDLSIGEPTGEGYQDHSLEALIVRARRQAADTKQT